MKRDIVKFDLVTHRFITNRWRTPEGREVRDKLIKAIKLGADISDVLSPYVLEHPDNVEPYEYPFYPPDAMESREFWLLTSDDLRGIHFHGEDFSGTTSLAKNNISFSHFTDCDLSNVDFEMCDLSHARLYSCHLAGVIFAYSRGVDVKFVDCILNGASFLGSHFSVVDLSGTELKSVYFEDTILKKLKVNYLTKFDKRIQHIWHERRMPKQQLPDIYRAIRIAYQNAELINYADHYLMQERISNRKYVFWPRFLQSHTWLNFSSWAKDLIWSGMAGYGTKPFRIVLIGFLISMLYALVYFLAGAPKELTGEATGYIGAIYFSITTFATLGYGDLTYEHGRHFMRLVSTSEAVLGAIFIALFVVVLARKIIR